MSELSDAILTLDPNPGSIDGHVGGVIAFPCRLSQAKAFRVELLCTRSRRRARDNDSSVVWQDFAVRRGDARADGATAVSFCFALPDDVPNTSDDPLDRHTWTLRITSDRADIDFSRHWDVPVLGTGQRASDTLAALVVAPSNAADVDESMHLTRAAGAVVMNYAAGRGASSSTWLLVFGLCFSGAAWLLGHANAILMSAVFWLVGLGATAFGMWRLGHALRVEIRSQTLFVRRSLFGVPMSRLELPFSSIAAVASSKSVYSEQGTQPRLFYNLIVRTHDDQTVVIGNGFVSYGSAMSAARRLAELTGLRVLGEPEQRPLHTRAAIRSIASAAPAAARPLPAKRGFLDRVVDNQERIRQHQSYIGPGVGGVIFVVLGCLFGGVQYGKIVVRGVSGSGTIVDSHRTQTHSRGHLSTTSYHPIVELEVNGQTIRFEDWWGSKSRPTPGERVTVLYDAENPAHAMIDSGARTWIPWAPLLGFGAFLLGVSLKNWLASLRA